MEEYVPYKLEEKLRRKGFPAIGKEITDGDRGVFCPSATIAQVLKWLREEKKLHIAVDIWSREWGYDVLRLMGGDNLHWSGIANYKNYEEAALAGIEYVLDNLI